MSSASSIRRIKERGGGGGVKIEPLLPTKTLIPISQRPVLIEGEPTLIEAKPISIHEKPSVISSGRRSIGKENPRMGCSRVPGPAGHKPVIRPMARVSDAETRSRSRPRGRSPSPSDFSRVLSDMRKGRVLGNEGVVGKNVSGVRGLERKGVGEFSRDRGARVSKESGSVGGKVRGEWKKDGSLCVDLAKAIASGGDDGDGVDRCVDHGGKDRRFSVVDDVRARKGGKFDIGSKDGSFSVVDDVRGRRDAKIDHGSKDGSFGVVVDDVRARKGVKLDGNVGLVSNGVDRCVDGSDEDGVFSVVDNVRACKGEEKDRNVVLKSNGLGRFVDHGSKNLSFSVANSVGARKGECLVANGVLKSKGVGNCADQRDKDGIFSGVDNVSSCLGGNLHPNFALKHNGVGKSTDQSGKNGSLGGVDNVCLGEKLDQNVVLKTYGALNGGRSSLGLSGKGAGVKNTSSLKGSDVFKEKAVNEGGASGRGGSKSASRLQEKLAYLEGKVKRIASDIKKTKEMLDMNNTDASKVIISDIQEKISGIEKAMGNVIADSSTQFGVDLSGNLENAKSNGTDVFRITSHEETQNDHVDSARVSVKALSGQELEARLFPHHKLLRDRTSSKASASSSLIDGNHVSDSNHGSSSREKSFSPIEDNPIALQFLASLNKVKSEVCATDAEVVLIADEVQNTEEAETSTARRSSGISSGKQTADIDLQANEKLDEFDEQENKPATIVEEEMEDESGSQLMEIGRKTSTGGWFVSDGESVLLAHDDGSCSYHDIINNEEKAEYIPPSGISQNMWRDCWIIRAPGADGCSGKYVVAASAGNTMDSGFCSWDFYTKDVCAFHVEDYTTNPRVALSPLPDNIMHRRNALSGISSENRQWWYRPCGPLIISTASCQKAVKVFDIRDGEQIMKWDVQKPVATMDFSSPLQWKNRGKVVVAEAEAISLWDVSTLNPQALSSVSTSGRRISALHVNNTDAELGGGVRQRVSSSEAEGNDGVFCTADSINILDFRQPSGIGLKIPKIGVSVQSVFSRGDSVFLGCSSVISAAKKQVQSQVLQLSLRKQKVVSTYNLPESNAHSHHKALTQVWGNSSKVMAVCGLGLFTFDKSRDDGLPSFASDCSSPQNVREVIGPDDLYSPSFDYLSSQILLISRDRPALWRQLS